ncbi:hypothetical protein [Pseudoalteromonas umbrosa]|uniref:hypothetical protein n=1 Tax=Pseudoalteromonas umbrosa TaxID=3048489 RepID=UPI0024C40ADB|nr:hypothetical protein [Pseudoalteromonas sp. B95]MDK1287417.1 hypothetical protein [Pseudoalteromonas sp. B95]
MKVQYDTDILKTVFFDNKNNLNKLEQLLSKAITKDYLLIRKLDSAPSKAREEIAEELVIILRDIATEIAPHNPSAFFHWKESLLNHIIELSSELTPPLCYVIEEEKYDSIDTYIALQKTINDAAIAIYDTLELYVKDSEFPIYAQFMELFDLNVTKIFLLAICKINDEIFKLEKRLAERNMVSFSLEDTTFTELSLREAYNHQ